MDDTYVNKLILDTEDSTNSVRRLKAEVELLQLGFKLLADRLREGKIADDEYLSASQALTEQLRVKSQLLEAVTGTGTSSGFKGLNQTLLQTSYAVQDFTSQIGTRGLAGALAAVQNNIPGILMGLGAGGGLAGVLSLVAVGVGAAMEGMKSFGKEARDATKDLEKLIEAGNKLAAGPTTLMDETSKGVSKFIKDASGPQVALAINAALGREGAGLAPNQRGRFAELSRAESAGDLTETERGELAAMRGGMRAEQDKQTSLLMGALPTDRSARQRVAAMARATPGDFPQRFADELGEFEPEVLARKAKEKQDAKDMDAERGGEKEIGRDKKEREDAIRRRAQETQRIAKEQADKAKRTEDLITQTYVDDAIENEREIEKQKREAEHKAREAARAAKERARANDPSNMEAAERARITDQATTMARNTPGPNGWVPDQGQFRSMVSEAVNNVPMGGGQDAIQAAINQAAWKGYQKAIAEWEGQMGRMNAMSNQRGGQ